MPEAWSRWRIASSAERDAAVDDLIALVVGVDGLLQAQAKADVAYFINVTGNAIDAVRAAEIDATVLKAYRWQYIVSGVMEPRFQKVLGGLINDAQMQRIQGALAPLLYAIANVCCFIVNLCALALASMQQSPGQGT